MQALAGLMAPEFARSSSRLSDFGNRLTQADMGSALHRVLVNTYIARTVISLLVIMFGIVVSVLYVKYSNHNDVKKQTQLAYTSRLWFGDNSGGLLWTLAWIWAGTAAFIVFAPLLMRMWQIWKVA